MDGIYLITPCEKSVHALINDFSVGNRIMYKAAHVFFTEGMWNANQVLFVFNFF